MGVLMQTAGGEAGLVCPRCPCSKSLQLSLVALLPYHWLRLYRDPSYTSKHIKHCSEGALATLPSALGQMFKWPRGRKMLHFLHSLTLWLIVSIMI